jgi:hypothetical protein
VGQICNLGRDAYIYIQHYKFRFEKMKNHLFGALNNIKIRHENVGAIKTEDRF